MGTELRENFEYQVLDLDRGVFQSYDDYLEHAAVVVHEELELLKIGPLKVELELVE